MDAEEKTHWTDCMVLLVHEGTALYCKLFLAVLPGRFPRDSVLHQAGSGQWCLYLAEAGASEPPQSCWKLQQARHIWSSTDGGALLRHGGSGDTSWLLILALGSNAWMLAGGSPQARSTLILS